MPKKWEPRPKKLEETQPLVKPSTAEESEPLDPPSPGWKKFLLDGDPISITDVTKVVTVKPIAVVATAASDNVIWSPASGKAIRLKVLEYESKDDADVSLKFWGGDKFSRRVKAGAMAMNLIGANVQGGVNVPLYVRTEAAVSVYGFVGGEEV